VPACEYEGDQSPNTLRGEKGEIIFFRIGLELKTLVVCPVCGAVRAE